MNTNMNMYASSSVANSTTTAQPGRSQLSKRQHPAVVRNPSGAPWAVSNVPAALYMQNVGAGGRPMHIPINISWPVQHHQWLRQNTVNQAHFRMSATGAGLRAGLLSGGLDVGAGRRSDAVVRPRPGQIGSGVLKNNVGAWRAAGIEVSENVVGKVDESVDIGAQANPTGIYPILPIPHHQRLPHGHGELSSTFPGFDILGIHSAHNRCKGTTGAPCESLQPQGSRGQSVPPRLMYINRLVTEAGPIASSHALDFVHNTATPRGRVASGPHAVDGIASGSGTIRNLSGSPAPATTTNMAPDKQAAYLEATRAQRPVQSPLQAPRVSGKFPDVSELGGPSVREDKQSQYRLNVDLNNLNARERCTRQRPQATPASSSRSACIGTSNSAVSALDMRVGHALTDEACDLSALRPTGTMRKPVDRRSKSPPVSSASIGTKFGSGTALPTAPGTSVNEMAIARGGGAGERGTGGRNLTLWPELGSEDLDSWLASVGWMMHGEGDRRAISPAPVFQTLKSDSGEASDNAFLFLEEQEVPSGLNDEVETHRDTGEMFEEQEGESRKSVVLAQVTRSEVVEPASVWTAFQRHSYEKRTVADTAAGSVSSDRHNESRKSSSPTDNGPRGQNSSARSPDKHEEGNGDDDESHALILRYGKGRVPGTGSASDTGMWRAVAGTSTAKTAATNAVVLGTSAGSSFSDVSPGSWSLFGRVSGGLDRDGTALRLLGVVPRSAGGSTEQYRGNADSDTPSCNDTARPSSILPSASMTLQEGVAAGSELAFSRKHRSIPAAELSTCSPPRLPAEQTRTVAGLKETSEERGSLAQPGGDARSGDTCCRECSPRRSLSVLLTDSTSTWDEPAARSSPESLGPTAASHPIAKSKPMANPSRPRSQDRESSREARAYTLSPPSPPPLALSRPIPVRPPPFQQHQDCTSASSVPGFSSLPRFPEWANCPPPLPSIHPCTPRHSTLSFTGAALSPTREHPQGLPLGRDRGSPTNRRRKWDVGPGAPATPTRATSSPPLLGSLSRLDLEHAASPPPLSSVSAASGSRSLEGSCVVDGCNAPVDYRPADHRRDGDGGGGGRDRGVWCTVHREDGAVLYEGGFCGFPGCRTRPSWGCASKPMTDTTSATPKRCCYRHKHDGMVNVGDVLEDFDDQDGEDMDSSNSRRRGCGESIKIFTSGLLSEMRIPNPTPHPATNRLLSGMNGTVEDRQSRSSIYPTYA